MPPTCVVSYQELQLRSSPAGSAHDLNEAPGAWGEEGGARVREGDRVAAAAPGPPRRGVEQLPGAHHADPGCLRPNLPGYAHAHTGALNQAGRVAVHTANPTPRAHAIQQSGFAPSARAKGAT